MLEEIDDGVVYELHRAGVLTYLGALDYVAKRVPRPVLVQETSETFTVYIDGNKTTTSNLNAAIILFAGAERLAEGLRKAEESGIKPETDGGPYK